MRIKFYAFYLIVCSFLLAFPASVIQAQPTQTQRPNVNINADVNGYLEYLPQGYDPNGTTKFPLLVYLPGISQAGNGNTDLASLLDINPAKYIAGDINNRLSSFTVDGQTFRFIMITPQFVHAIQERYPTVDEINDVINYAIEHYKVDQTRIYLMGISTGGGSVWHYATAGSFYANRIAAIVPFSGTDTPTLAKATVLKNANMPIWAFHNSADAEVNAYYTSGWFDFIAAAGGYSNPHKRDIWTTTDPFDHNSWDDHPVHDGGAIIGAYSEPDTGIDLSKNLNIYQWMLQFTRPAPTSNLAPTAFAGPNRSIVAPNDTVHFDAFAKDLDSYTLTYSWIKQSGPGSPTFSSTNTRSTVVSGLSQGTYVFRFSVSDGNSTTISDVTINVLAPGSLTTIEGENAADPNHVRINSNAARHGGQYLVFNDVFAWANFPIRTNGGTFDFRFTVQSPFAKALNLFVASTHVGTLNIPAGGSTWQTLNLTGISLPAGAQTLTISPGNTNWNPGGALDSISLDFFQFATPGNINLPVKFTYFNSSCRDGLVSLQWKTAQEINSRNFSVERSSDGVKWSEVGSVGAAGQSSDARSYSFEDRSGAAASGSMYRIVEYDYNGQSTISSIVRSSCSSMGAEIMTLYPNPSSGSSALSIHLEHSTKLSLQVLDSKGALMYQSQMQLPAGVSSIPLNTTAYSAGVYTIKVYYDTEMKTLKMIKK